MKQNKIKLSEREVKFT